MANFQKLLSRKHTPLVDSILVSAWNDKERFLRVVNFPEYVQNLEILQGDFYFDTEWMDTITSKYAEERPEFFLNFTKRGCGHGDSLVKFARSLDPKIGSKDLLKVYQDSVELLKNLLVFLPETHPLAKAIEKKLTSILKEKGLDEEKIHEMLMVLSTPVKLNGPALEIKELREIKNRKWNTPAEKEEALKQHVKKFEYLGYREPFSKGYDLKFFTERIHDSLEEVTSPEEKNINLTKDEQIYVDLMQEYVYFRNYRTEKLYEALYYIEPLWQDFSKSLGVDSKDLFFYLLEEADGLINEQKKISSEIINDRKEGYGFLLHNNSTRIITGIELATQKQKREGKIVETQIIKGMIACKGIVKGKAKIIFKASEQSKIESGDILITSMTTPDFLPSMQRAAAFVTDEGGITCHAAIVAREMKKPCIIGTKIATKILKDGMEVEIDADKGIIKIVS